MATQPTDMNPAHQNSRDNKLAQNSAAAHVGGYYIAAAGAPALPAGSAGGAADGGHIGSLAGADG